MATKKMPAAKKVAGYEKPKAKKKAGAKTMPFTTPKKRKKK